MKKVISILCLFVSLSIPVFAGAYEDNMAKAKDYEAKKQYIYAIGYYYDAAMLAETDELHDVAYDKISGIVARLKKGSDGLELSLWDDPKEAWDKVLLEFFRYFTEFSPYDLKRGRITYRK